MQFGTRVSKAMVGTYYAIALERGHSLIYTTLGRRNAEWVWTTKDTNFTALMDFRISPLLQLLAVRFPSHIA